MRWIIKAVGNERNVAKEGVEAERGDVGGAPGCGVGEGVLLIVRNLLVTAL